MKGSSTMNSTPQVQTAGDGVQLGVGDLGGLNVAPVTNLVAGL